MKAWVTANGQRVEIALPITLDEFLRSRNIPPGCVVVELNGEAVAPSEFPDRSLGEGDRLEIVRVVAGGRGRYSNE